MHVAEVPRPRGHPARRARPPVAGRRRREEPLQDGLFGPQALFGFEWQLSLHGDELTDEEMDELARATSPIIKLRDNWVAVDSAVIKRARKRLIRTVTPVQALAATLTGVVDIEDVALRGGRRAPACSRSATGCAAAATGEPVDVPPALRADAARLPAPRPDLAGRAHLARARRLPGRRHGAGQDGHADRAAPAPADGGGRRRSWSARRRCSATGRPRSAGSRPGVAVRRHHGSARDLDGVTERLRAHDLRHDAQRRRAARRGAVGPGRRRRGAAHQELPRPPPPGRCAPSRARRAWR